MPVKLSPKNVSIRGWSRKATLDDGRVFWISVTRGKRVRIPFKPRGQNIGFHWHAHVQEYPKDHHWAGRVTKSLGVRGCLIEAGVIEVRE